MFGRSQKSEVSKVDLSKLPFDKEIELAKLQLTAADYQTRYNTMVAVCLSTALTFFGLVVIGWTLMEANPSLGHQLTWIGEISAFVFLFLILPAGKTNDKRTRKIRQGFIDIYNHKRIDD